MLSKMQCRKLLGSCDSLTDGEMELLTTEMYGLAEVLILSFGRSEAVVPRCRTEPGRPASKKDSRTMQAPTDDR